MHTPTLQEKNGPIISGHAFGGIMLLLAVFCGFLVNYINNPVISKKNSCPADRTNPGSLSS